MKESLLKLLKLVYGSSSKPFVCFDVGANLGQSIESIASELNGARIFAFEPYYENYRILAEKYKNSSNIEIYDLAISDCDGKAVLNVFNQSAVNSLLAPSEALKQWADNESLVNLSGNEIIVSTLDSFCKAHAVSKIDYLKLDIQGNELNALKGASGLLESQSILSIRLEALFQSFYEKQAYFWDIAAFMSEYKYKFYAFENEVKTPEGMLKYAEALFISDSFFNDITASSSPRGQRRLLFNINLKKDVFSCSYGTQKLKIENNVLMTFSEQDHIATEFIEIPCKNDLAKIVIVAEYDPVGMIEKAVVAVQSLEYNVMTSISHRLEPVLEKVLLLREDSAKIRFVISAPSTGNPYLLPISVKIYTIE